jgi:hypothetical protein
MTLVKRSFIGLSIAKNSLFFAFKHPRVLLYPSYALVAIGFGISCFKLVLLAFGGFCSIDPVTKKVVQQQLEAYSKLMLFVFSLVAGVIVLATILFMFIGLLNFAQAVLTGNKICFLDSMKTRSRVKTIIGASILFSFLARGVSVMPVLDNVLEIILIPIFYFALSYALLTEKSSWATLKDFLQLLCKIWLEFTVSIFLLVVFLVAPVFLLLVFGALGAHVLVLITFFVLCPWLFFALPSFGVCFVALYNYAIHDGKDPFLSA